MSLSTLFQAIHDGQLSFYTVCRPNTFITAFPGLMWPPFFAVYSLMVILIEKKIKEMNLDIDRVIRIFSHLSMSFNIGWD